MFVMDMQDTFSSFHSSHLLQHESEINQWLILIIDQAVAFSYYFPANSYNTTKHKLSWY